MIKLNYIRISTENEVGIMKYDFTNLLVRGDGKDARRAASLFKYELAKRTGRSASDFSLPENALGVLGGKVIELLTDDKTENKDFYIIEQSENAITISAKTVRGLIFGYSLFLRKCEFKDGKITLVKNISGKYSPDKKIRGHQIGYRSCPNTYDAWDYKQYFNYYLDMAAFGCNTCEHIPYEKTHSARNCLMKYDEEDFLVTASRMAKAIDMDVSVWHPNCDGETEDEAVLRREKLYERVPKLDAVFPPGGDPGKLSAKDFVNRTVRVSEALKKSHPGASMWPSAQAPHIHPNWGEEFIELIKETKSGIDGIITGPNHAFPMHELRKKLPSRYPIRFYPDFTHSLRCEYPVHFLTDDWHYSLASVFSRESVDPRPTELLTLHRLYSQYTVGSVSYSEGVHDDVNKAVWSALEFDKNANLRDILLDYARFFMYGADSERLCNAIFALEKNWDCDPLYNPSIDVTYREFCALRDEYPFLWENWRFLLLYFRACGDEFVYKKRLFETELINEALPLLEEFKLSEAKITLNTPTPSEITDIRAELTVLGKKLFELIGIQLDIKNYHANGWERGATLETADNPITDRQWLLNRLDYASTLPECEKNGFITRLLNRNRVLDDEIYYSVALHELSALGIPQNGEFYMDFQGDRPEVNNGSIPMSMLKVFDHFSFEAHFGGFSAGHDYTLSVNYKEDYSNLVKHHKVTANGVVIYDGTRYGGTVNERFNVELSAPGFTLVEYTLPQEIFENGTLELKIEEPILGFEVCELWIKRKNDSN